MREKKLLSLLQLRVTPALKERLAQEADRLGLTEASLARLSLRQGLSHIAGKLPDDREARDAT